VPDEDRIIPFPQERAEGLRFPDIMTGAAGEFAAVYEACMEPPKKFFYVSYLTCLGSVLAGRLTLNTEISPQPRLNVVLLGESADDRKSTAIRFTTDFFKDTLTDFSLCYGVGSAEGLAKRFEGSKNVLLVYDEFKSLISKCKIESSVLLTCINTLFELNRYESITQKHDIRLDGVHLSLLAASTIGTYERVWDSSFTDIGFNNRLFLVPGCGVRKNAFPERVPFNDRAWLQRRLGEVLNHVGSGLELDMTPEAHEIYQAWYLGLPRSIHAKRLDTYALRFMGLLAVNELKTVIDEDVIEKVTQLCNWQLEVRRLHDPIDADSEMAKMEERIRRALSTGRKTDRALRQSTHANRAGLFLYQNAIRNLQGSKEIDWDKASRTWGLT